MKSNVQRMRETLERIYMKLVSINCVDSVQKRSIDNCRILIKQAVAIPLRNCDVYNWREAWDKWRKENHPQNPDTLKECYDSTTTFMDWFMSKAEKGVNDGK